MELVVDHSGHHHPLVNQAVATQRVGGAWISHSDCPPNRHPPASAPCLFPRLYGAHTCFSHTRVIFILFTKHKQAEHRHLAFNIS